MPQRLLSWRVVVRIYLFPIEPGIYERLTGQTTKDILKHSDEESMGRRGGSITNAKPCTWQSETLASCDGMHIPSRIALEDRRPARELQKA